jgi:predicted TIM-barrel fold metal-dependent hydrolase
MPFVKIDVHLHLRGGPPTGRNPLRRLAHRVGEWWVRRGLERGADPDDEERTEAAALGALVGGSELDRAVALAFDGVHDAAGAPDPGRTYYFVSNERAARIRDLAPDRLLFGASVHPHRPDALDELDRVRALGAVLVKLLPNSHGFDPADPRHGPYWRRLADLGLPLLSHGGFEHTVPVQDQSFGDPARLRPALDAGVTVIVAHCGGAGLFHREETFGAFLELAAAHPNCFGDTSALSNFWRSRYLFELLAPEALAARYPAVPEEPLARLVHGSDFPIPITPSTFAGRTPRAARRELLRGEKNPLQRDIGLKRLAGLPDEVLERGAHLLGL